MTQTKGTTLMSIITTPVKPGKNRRTHEQYEAAKSLAVSMSGYDDTSPIWNKTLPQILDMIDDRAAVGNTAAILAITLEIRKRLTKSALLHSSR